MLQASAGIFVEICLTLLSGINRFGLYLQACVVSHHLLQTRLGYRFTLQNLQTRSSESGPVPSFILEECHSSAMSSLTLVANLICITYVSCQNCSAKFIAKLHKPDTVSKLDSAFIRADSSPQLENILRTVCRIRHEEGQTKNKIGIDLKGGKKRRREDGSSSRVCKAHYVGFRTVNQVEQ